jgi:hypothetical protein
VLTGHDACAHQHLDVVSKQVRRDIQHPGELGGGGITDLEAVNDPKPHRIAERGMNLGSTF